MTTEERIVLLSRSRSILEGRGRVSISDAHDLIVRVIDDMIDEVYEKIAR
jgi:hypothetical protein